MLPKRQRPIGIALLAVLFLWIGGFGSFVFPIFVVTGVIKQAVELWLSPDKHSNLLIVSVTTLFSLILWCVYILYAFVGYGLLKLRRWAWKGMVIIQWFGVALFIGQAIIFGIIFSSVAVGIGTGVFCLGMTAGILWYLYRPMVRWPFEATYAESKGLPVPVEPAGTQMPKWKRISIGIGVGFVIFGAFGVSLFFSVEHTFRSSDVYRIALADANASPCVVAVVGQPIVGKGSINGSLQTSGDKEGSADMDFAIHGPRGDARITLVAKKIDGAWQFTTLTVDPYNGAPIQLLPDPTPCK